MGGASPWLCQPAPLQVPAVVATQALLRPVASLRAARRWPVAGAFDATHGNAEMKAIVTARRARQVGRKKGLDRQRTPRLAWKAEARLGYD